MNATVHPIAFWSAEPYRPRIIGSRRGRRPRLTRIEVNLVKLEALVAMTDFDLVELDRNAVGAEEPV